MNLPTAPAQATVNADLGKRRSTRLEGPWLAFLRLTWIILSSFALFLFIESLPVYFSSQLKSYTVDYAVFLLALGIFVALVWFIVALLIFWRKSNDWLALLVSFMLVLQGAGTTIYPFDVIHSFWQLPALIMNLIAFDLLFLVFCLFPTGRFVPRWILWLGVLLLGWEVLAFIPILPKSLGPLVNFVAYIFLGGFVVAQLYRYHSVSSRTERLQTKWIVFGVTVTYLIEFGVVLCTDLFPSFFSTSSIPGMILSLISNIVPILIPLTFGFAILRSHLWEIDVIIHRTLVYGTLTTLLILIYFGDVIGLQSLLHGFTGSNQLAIVGTTLAIAALSQPLRQRIQRIIDQRFYRRKYDAARTVEAFAVDLRNEVDLNTLKEHLLAVVQETMQPAHVSLWLCAPKRSDEKTTRALPVIDTVGTP